MTAAHPSFLIPSYHGLRLLPHSLDLSFSQHYRIGPPYLRSWPWAHNFVCGFGCSLYINSASLWMAKSWESMGCDVYCASACLIGSFNTTNIPGMLACRNEISPTCAPSVRVSLLSTVWKPRQKTGRSIESNRRAAQSIERLGGALQEDWSLFCKGLLKSSKAGQISSSVDLSMFERMSALSQISSSLSASYFDSLKVIVSETYRKAVGEEVASSNPSKASWKDY